MTTALSTLILLIGLGFATGGHFLQRYADQQSQMPSTEDMRLPKFSPGLRLTASGTAFRTTGIVLALVGLAGIFWSVLP